MGKVTGGRDGGPIAFELDRAAQAKACVMMKSEVSVVLKKLISVGEIDHRGKPVGYGIGAMVSAKVK